MPALAKVMEGLPREMCLLDGHGLDDDADTAKERVALSKDFRTELPLDDDREFNEISGGDTTGAERGY